MTPQIAPQHRHDLLTCPFPHFLQIHPIDAQHWSQHIVIDHSEEEPADLEPHDGDAHQTDLFESCEHRFSLTHAHYCVLPYQSVFQRHTRWCCARALSQPLSRGSVKIMPRPRI